MNTIIHNGKKLTLATIYKGVPVYYFNSGKSDYCLEYYVFFDQKQAFFQFFDQAKKYIQNYVK